MCAQGNQQFCMWVYFNFQTVFNNHVYICVHIVCVCACVSMIKNMIQVWLDHSTLLVCWKTCSAEKAFYTHFLGKCTYSCLFRSQKKENKCACCDMWALHTYVHVWVQDFCVYDTIHLYDWTYRERQRMMLIFCFWLPNQQGCGPLNFEVFHFTLHHEPIYILHWWNKWRILRVSVLISNK